jgi:hypothetical protein
MRALGHSRARYSDPFDLQDKCNRKELKDVLDIHGSLFVQGSHVSPRVAAQHGYVSIHRDLKSPIDQQCSSALSKLWHITVPAKSRMDFQEGIFSWGSGKIPSSQRLILSLGPTLEKPGYTTAFAQNVIMRGRSDSMIS